MRGEIGVLFLGCLSAAFAAQSLFIATVPYQLTPTVSAGQPLPFNFTFQNVHGAYDNVTNTFTCPTTGFYSFSFMVTKMNAVTQSDEFHLMSSLSTDILLKVVLPQVNNQYSSNSGSVVYKCTKDEYLWVQMCTFCGDNPLQLAWDLNMFSGAFLSHPIHTDSFIATLPYNNAQGGLNIVTIYSGDTVPFSYPMQNPGSAYNTTDFRFTCPQTGSYIFSFSTARNNDNAGSAEFHLKSTIASDVIMKVVEPGLSYQFSSNGGTVMYHCQAGESLWVDMCSYCGTNAYDLAWDLNNFSGGLVKSGPSYSFIAKIPYQEVITVTSGQVVPFSYIQQNEGVMYNNQTNSYTCPYTGFYSFSFMITRLDYDDWSREFHLVSSGSSQILLKVILPQLSVQFSSNSGHVLYQCTQGEQLWVQMCDYCSDGPAQLAWDLNMFSGQLIP